MKSTHLKSILATCSAALLVSISANSYSGTCDPDLSTESECWTNCSTENDITICDIIQLDGFWPENKKKMDFTSKNNRLSHILKTKTYAGNKIAKGKVIERK